MTGILFEMSKLGTRAYKQILFAGVSNLPISGFRFFCNPYHKHERIRSLQESEFSPFAVSPRYQPGLLVLQIFQWIGTNQCNHDGLRWL